MSDQENTIDTTPAEAPVVEVPVSEAKEPENPEVETAAAEVAADQPAEEEVTGEAESDPTRLELPVLADIRMAAEIHEQCEAALEASGDVRIDCSAVERIDAAVLQCIGALASSLEEGARQLELVGRSEPFDRAASVLGFDVVLAGRSSETVG